MQLQVRKTHQPSPRHLLTSRSSTDALDPFGTPTPYETAHAHAQHLRTPTTLTAVGRRRRVPPSARCAVFVRCPPTAQAGSCGIVCSQMPTSSECADSSAANWAGAHTKPSEHAVPELSVGPSSLDVLVYVFLYIRQPHAGCTVLLWLVGARVDYPHAVAIHAVGRNRGVHSHPHAQRTRATFANVWEGRIIEPALASRPINIPVSPVRACRDGITPRPPASARARRRTHSMLAARRRAQGCSRRGGAGRQRRADWHTWLAARAARNPERVAGRRARSRGAHHARAASAVVVGWTAGARGQRAPGRTDQQQQSSCHDACVAVRPAEPRHRGHAGAACPSGRAHAAKSSRGAVRARMATAAARNPGALRRDSAAVCRPPPGALPDAPLAPPPELAPTLAPARSREGWGPGASEGWVGAGGQEISYKI